MRLYPLKPPSGVVFALQFCVQESTKKYKAFISYSHANNQGEGRKWADWLHHALETYEIPEDLIGQKNQFDQEIPRQLFPVFQDEKELSASSNLNTALTNALDNSEYLIYLSSPRSAKSIYVRDEIRHFKKTGKTKQIIALILSGEPEYGDEQTDAQCFPDELRYNVDAEGNVLYDQPEEVLAADVRIPNTQEEGFTSPEAYRQYLHSQGVSGTSLKSAVEAYKQRLDLALLKIIAGILGVPLRELTKRDQAYQLEKAKRRHRTIKRVAITITALAVLAIITGIVAWNQKNSALRNLARSLYASGINKLTESEYGDGAAYIAEATRQGDRNAELFAHSMLAVQEDLIAMPNASVGNIRFSPDGQWLAAFANSGLNTNVLQIWNAIDRKRYKQLDQVKTNQPNPPLFDAENRVYVTSENHVIVRYDIAGDKLDIIRPNPDSSFLTIKSVSPDGKYVVYGRPNLTVLFNTTNQTEKLLFQATDLTSADVFFDGTSSTAVIDIPRSQYHEIVIYDLTAPDVKEVTRTEIPSSTRRPSFSKDGKQVAINSLNALFYYNLTTGRAWKINQGVYNYRYVGFTDKGILNAGNEYRADIIDVSNGRVQSTKPLSKVLRLMTDFFQMVQADQFNFENHSPDWTQEIVNKNTQSFIKNAQGAPLRPFQQYADQRLKKVIPGITAYELFILNKDSTSVDKMDIRTGERHAKFLSISEAIADIHLLNRPQILLVKDVNNRTYFFDATSGKPIGEPFDSEVKSYIFNTDQTQVLARTGPDRFGIWEIPSGRKRVTFVYPDTLEKFTANPDFTTIFVAGHQSWKIIDIKSQEIVKEGKGAVSSGAYSSTGKHLVIVDATGKAQIVDTRHYQPFIEFQSIEFPFIVFNHAGNVVAISEDAEHMRLWDLDTKKTFGQTIRVSKFSKYFHFSEDDSRIFVQDDGDNFVPVAKIVDAKTGSILTMPFINQQFDAIYVMPGDQQLMTVESLAAGYAFNFWEIPGQVKISQEQLASDLEKFYGKKYDPETGAVLTYTDTTHHFSTWYFDDPFLRTVSPSSTVSIPDRLAENYPIKTDANLHLLAETYPYHPLARAMVAEYFCSFPETHYLGQRMLDITNKQLIKIKNEKLRAAVETRLKTARALLTK